ncbi:MAG TPA: hypothetical protein GX734_06275 [Clostridiaceae bacterium]|nr:hypothetical protein [Clostridiaceae bacterium]
MSCQRKSIALLFLLKTLFSFVLVVSIIISSLCFVGCQQEEKIAPNGDVVDTRTIDRDPVDSEQPNPIDGEEPTPSDGEVVYDVGSLARRIGELPDVYVQAEEAPASLTGRWYIPSIETIFAVLMNDRTLEDFNVTTEALHVTPNAFTVYTSKTDVLSFTTDVHGDFSFSLDPKMSSDIEWVLSSKRERPFGDDFVKEKDYFNDSSLLIMDKDEAIELAQTTLKRLGYVNIVLQDVIALNHEKILEKTLEYKCAAEEFKKQNPAYEMYDYRTEWEEKDGKYAMYFLSLGPYNIPLHESGNLATEGEFSPWDRLGTLIYCFVGQDGLEHIEVRSFYVFDEPSEANTRLLTHEEITEKFNGLYTVRPEVSSFELGKIRLRYLADKYRFSEALPDALSFTPVYTCTIVEKTEKPGTDVCIVTQDLVFNAITGELITDTIFR